MRSVGGDPFTPVASGQSVTISAELMNTLKQMARQFRGRGVSGGSPVDFGFDGIPTVMVKNSSGAAVDRFGVLGISSIGITPTDNAEFWKNVIFMVGVTPTTSYMGKFVVLAQPIANGAIGKAFIDGVFPAKVNIVTSGDERADVKDSDATQLQSGATGAAQILWVESGTGTKNAIVRMSGSASDIGLYQGDVHQMMTDESDGWGPAQFGP